jgi:hypothetical protein
MKWKVDKLLYKNTDIVENRLNDLSDSGWEIYKIHFDKTSAGYSMVTIVAKKR